MNRRDFIDREIDLKPNDWQIIPLNYLFTKPFGKHGHPVYMTVGGRMNPNFKRRSYIHAPKISKQHEYKFFKNLDEAIVLAIDLLSKEKSFENTTGELFGKRQHRPIIEFRHAVWWLLCENKKTIADFSLVKVGQAFNKRDHSTIINGRNTVNDLLAVGYKKYKNLPKLSEKLNKALIIEKPQVIWWWKCIAQ